MKKVLRLIIPLLFIGCASVDKIPEPSINWEAVAYNSDIKCIINDNCVSCHGDLNPAAELSLTSLEKVKNAALNHNLLHRITDQSNPMPIGELLPKTERRKILHWANNGYPA